MNGGEYRGRLRRVLDRNGIAQRGELERLACFFLLSYMRNMEGVDKQFHRSSQTWYSFELH
jgi:hypothetical protein